MLKCQAMQCNMYDIAQQCAAKASYLFGMLHCRLIELAPHVICKLLMCWADIKVGTVSPLLGQHGPIVSTLR